jgi:hypothetical protein
MSAASFTSVPSFPSSSHDVTDAFAAPLPFCSVPLAASFTRWAASSRSSIRTVPANDIATGPNFTFTLPRHELSSIVSVSSAPGRHGAIVSTSRR